MPAISFDDYVAAVEKIRARISDGDVYQVNFTFPCSVPVVGSPEALYAQLLSRAAAQWSALPEDARYVLFRLAEPRRGPEKLDAALRELGLAQPPP